MAKALELPTLIVDSREKKPLDLNTKGQFKEVVHRKLDQGDYSIVGIEHIIMIERKASVDEMYANFCKKATRDRIFREFERSLHIPHKFLVASTTWDDIYNPSAYYVNQRGANRRSPYLPVSQVCTNLHELMIDYGVQVICSGDKTESIIRHLLLDVYKRAMKGEYDYLSE